MKKKFVAAVCLLAMTTGVFFSLSGCKREAEPLVGSLKTIEINGQEDMKTSLGSTACQEFSDMLNGFTLHMRDDDDQNAYETGLFFRVESEEGKWSNIQFFDRIMSVNDERYYEISEQDFEKLKDFCIKHKVHSAPKLVLEAKAFLKSIDYGNVIDYSFYHFSEIKDLKQLTQIGAEVKEINEENKEKYYLASLGDAEGKSTIESGQLHLVMEKETGRVIWYEPID